VLVPSQTVSGDHYTYLPNKFFYDQSLVRYSKVVLKVITDVNSRLQALKTGQIDVAGGDVTTAPAAIAAGLTVQHATQAYTGLAFYDRAGATVKALADVRVRQALNYAVDRNAIVKGLLGPYGTATSGVLSMETQDATVRNSYPYDPAKAKALLTAAGYPNGFTLPILEFTAYHPAGPVLAALAKYFGAVGVTVDIKPTATVGDYVSGLATTPCAEVVIPATDPMWSTYKFELAPAAFHNPQKIADLQIDTLWAQGSAATNPKPFWEQISKRATGQAFFLPVTTYDAFLFLNKKVGGSKLTSTRASLWFPTEWFPTKKS
jgi:peptide/nickel transport system substrate-binding protein